MYNNYYVIIIHVKDADCRKDKTQKNTGSLNYLEMWIQLSLLIDLYYFTGKERTEINFWLREVDANHSLSEK